MSEKMKKVDKKIVDELMNAFSRFHCKEMEASNRASERKRSEAKLLMILRESTDLEGMKVSDLSRLMRVTSPFVTQVLNSLEKEQLILRNHDLKDRRIVRVSLTDEGIEHANGVLAFFCEQFSILAEHLGSEGSDQLAKLLHKSFDFFDKQKKLY